MSTGSAGGDTAPTMYCRVCEMDVPAGAFCGFCGAELSEERGDGRGRLRIKSYGAAPGEHVLRLSVASSLFPHLPHRSRTPFRVGLAILILTMVVFALLHWQAPLIAVTALGLPLLFLIYLNEADVYRDLPVRSLLPTAVLGVALGVGWALLTGGLAEHSYDVALGTRMPIQRILLEGLAIPVGGAVLMLIPAAVARVLHRPTRESLDGFLIGSLGAIVFTAAATLTWLAPQLATGLTARGRPGMGLLVDAAIRGVAFPLTAAAVGGMFGAALWFTRRTAASNRGRMRLPALWAFAAVLVFYACFGLIDVALVTDDFQLALHLAVAVLALLALRITLQAALLHEAHDEMSPTEPLLCPHCGHVVPDMAFCPSCGVATVASSRSSRAARRRARPVRIDTTPNGP